MNFVGSEGLKFFDGYLSREESNQIFAAVNGPTFTWNEKPKLYGMKLPQHAYLYQRGKSRKTSTKLSMKSDGREALELLCQRILNDFGCSVQSVYCNRFQDLDHRIEWHRDKFGSHILVLTLGNGRRDLEFKDNSGSNLQRYHPKAGDLYFLSLQYNKEHCHRVLSTIESSDNSNNHGIRVSFVFFITAPFNIKEYKVSFMEQISGAINAMLT
mmetsp:Transcript_48433/g.117223  ORF Transcript_48433/g.117223 Transcript_48433/m.117223 type:complete len:213 (-) Transcript_48433:224-862(-)